jgi:hypothetical protein
VAEIDVVPRKRTNLWLWILLAVVVVVIAMMLLGVFSNDAASRVGAVMVPAAPASAGSGV